MTKIRVLIADDSPFIRQLFISFLQEDPEIEIAGEARTGLEALEMLTKTKPDVITMDYNMPVMDGLEALRKIMKLNPLPVIMISSFTKEGANITIEALEIGAFDFLTKPDATNYAQLASLKDDLIKKVKEAGKQSKISDLEIDKQTISTSFLNWKPFNSKLKLIIIGTSSGGPKALKKIIPLFPKTIPAAMIIVQHMPKGFTASLAQRLDAESSLEVKEAENGDKLRTGLALVAPGDFHLLVDSNHQVLLSKQAPLWGVRPAVDITLLSAAPIFKENLVGIILTGMGKDGTEGLLHLKEYGGRTIVEAEETCTVFGMPRSAIMAGAADIVLPLTAIPALVTSMYKGGNHG